MSNYLNSYNYSNVNNNSNNGEYSSESESNYDSDWGSDTNDFIRKPNPTPNPNQNYQIDYAVDTLSKELQAFEKDIENTLINKPTKNNSETEYTLYLNSQDRQLNGENTTFNFQIITDEQHTPGISNLSDIKRIEIINVVIPNFYINMMEVLYLDYNNFITSYTNTTSSRALRTQRLSDIPYILLQIGNYNNDLNIGSNTSFRNKSFVLKVDSMEERMNKNSGTYEIYNDLKVELGNINNSVLADTDKNVLTYVPMSDNAINFPNSSNRLTNFNVILKTQNNKQLKYLNDSLIIKTISFPLATDKKIGLEFTQYFSTDEYGLGDKIIIKPGTIIFDSNSDLENLKFFLEREEGHTIIEHFGASDGNPIDSTHLFKGLYIPAKFNYTNTNGTAHANIFKIFDFGVTTGTDISMDNTIITSNKVINQQNQIILTLKMTTNDYSM